MDPSLWLAQQVSPLTWLAAALFLIPILYLIGSAIRDRSWPQFGGGLALAGLILLIAIHRIVGGLLILLGVAILVVAIALPRWRGDRQEFQLD